MAMNTSLRTLRARSSGCAKGARILRCCKENKLVIKQGTSNARRRGVSYGWTYQRRAGRLPRSEPRKGANINKYALNMIRKTNTVNTGYSPVHIYNEVGTPRAWDCDVFLKLSDAAALET